MAPCIGLIFRIGMDAVDAAPVALGDDGGSTVAMHSASIPEGLKSQIHALAQGPSGTAIGFF